MIGACPPNDGNDWLDGGNGDDEVHGGNGDNVLFGGPGNDELTVERYFGCERIPGSNFLYGEQGNDLISAGDGDDMIQGGPGDDEIYCMAGMITPTAGLEMTTSMVGLAKIGFLEAPVMIDYLVVLGSIESLGTQVATSCTAATTGRGFVVIAGMPKWHALG